MIHRPIVPSEKLGYTTTHPECKCTWKEQETTKKKISTLTKSEQKTSTNIIRSITNKAKKGTLHTVFPDGHLSSRTRKTNPLYREAIMEVS